MLVCLLLFYLKFHVYLTSKTRGKKGLEIENDIENSMLTFTLLVTKFPWQNQFSLVLQNLKETRGLVVRQRAHDYEFEPSCFVHHTFGSKPANTWIEAWKQFILWNSFICCNPAKGRIDVKLIKTKRKREIERRKWNVQTISERGEPIRVIETKKYSPNNLKY